MQTGYERRLREMAAGGVERGFDETDISLVDTKGVTAGHLVGHRIGSDDEAGESIRARGCCSTPRSGSAPPTCTLGKISGSTIHLRVDGYMINAVDITETLFKRLLGLIKILCQTRRANSTVQDGHFSVAVRDAASTTGEPHAVRPRPEDGDPRARLAERRSTARTGLSSVAVREAPHDCDQGRAAAGLRSDGLGHHHALLLHPRDRCGAAERHHHRDPVEYYLDGCTQIPVEDQGNSFGSILRSVLRQDPDVIFVGEIRDIETATVAMQASMTGHLVYTTVHAKDSIGAIFRLLDLGVEAFLVANAATSSWPSDWFACCAHVQEGCHTDSRPEHEDGPVPRRRPRDLRAHGMQVRTGFIGRRAAVRGARGHRHHAGRHEDPQIQGIREIASRASSPPSRSTDSISWPGETTFEEIDRVAGSD